MTHPGEPIQVAGFSFYFHSLPPVAKFPTDRRFSNFFSPPRCMHLLDNNLKEWHFGVSPKPGRLRERGGRLVSPEISLMQEAEIADFMR
jgi:hypothetical protein